MNPIVLAANDSGEFWAYGPFDNHEQAETFVLMMEKKNPDIGYQVIEYFDQGEYS